MKKIETTSVIMEMVDRHYPQSIDWRLIDGIGMRDIPRRYEVQSIISKDQFAQIMMAAFGCTYPTIRNKWQILEAKNIIIPGRKDNGYIRLDEVKNAVPELRGITFNLSLYELDEKNTQKKYTAEASE